ncbi:MAG: uroporphyrinogen-III synthase [Azonexus sp.]|nr:uroporphyrinogen-III synthase [Azonexus sp.]
MTRPRAQAAPLAEAIAAAGGKPLIFPLLEIGPPASQEALNLAVRELTDYQLAVFISPNAVDYALPAILQQGPWPSTMRPAAVGPGTVKALAAYGVQGCVVPAGPFDSEALLALPELASEEVNGQRVAIFRGDGGRELLADTLRARGARVDCIPCYARREPGQGYETLLAAWSAGALDALTISSSEALRYLHDGLDATGLTFLAATPLFVPHARIAASARQLGLTKVIETPPADDGLISGLLAYNWSA